MTIQESFDYMMGGKSVGKSLMLNDFKKKLDAKGGYMSMIVDGRSNSGLPLSVGILEAYKEFFYRGSWSFSIH